MCVCVDELDYSRAASGTEHDIVKRRERACDPCHTLGMCDILTPCLLTLLIHVSVAHHWAVLCHRGVACSQTSSLCSFSPREGVSQKSVVVWSFINGIKKCGCCFPTLTHVVLSPSISMHLAFIMKPNSLQTRRVMRPQGGAMHLLVTKKGVVRLLFVRIEDLRAVKRGPQTYFSIQKLNTFHEDERVCLT